MMRPAHQTARAGRSACSAPALLGFALLACATASTGQEQSGQWGPYRGSEALPAALLAPGAVTAVWDHRIVGTTLKPRHNDVSYVANVSGGCMYVSAGDASTVWNTPIIVPDGANVQYLRIYVNDTSASNLSGWFTVYDLFGGIVQEWSVASSGTPGTAFFDSALINHVIDYSQYSYVINMRPSGTGSTLQFCGARIFFEPPPEIFRNGFETASSIALVQPPKSRQDGGN